jgi:anhydro-N-acetylmuramic acid kinase
MRVNETESVAVAFVEIGAICRVDLAVSGRPHRLTFDVGPGTCLLDESGEVGRIHYPLLEALLADPYFAQKPPKTAHADQFNAAWLQAKVAPHASLRAPDLQATLNELTARCVRSALALYMPEARDVRVSGEGARNAHLIRRLSVLLPNASVGVA